MKKNNNKIFNPLNGTEVLLDFDKVYNDRSLIKNENPFPFEVFPSDVQKIIVQTNDKLKFPIDYIGSSILFASSIAIGNSFKLKIQSTWEQAASLFIAIIGRAGANKSHPLTFALKPLKRLGSKAFAEYEKAKEEYEKATSMSLAERTESGIDEPVKPILKKYIVSDVTPEALMLVHKNNKRGIGLYVDELVSWIKNFNRYNGGGEQEFWNSIWSGQTSDVDRKNSESIMITDPFVSVCGTIQPGVLKELAGNDRDKNGFLERMLMVMPSGLKKEAWSKEELDVKYVQSWDTIIKRMLSFELVLDEDGFPVSEIMSFDKDARVLLNKWQAYNTQLVNSLTNNKLEGFYIKLESQCVRFCLLLQLFETVCDGVSEKKVSLSSVIGAIKLSEYFRINAIKVIDLLYNQSPLDDLPKNKRDLYEALPELFKTSDVIIKAKGFEIEERTAKRFLKNKDLFLRVGQGLYEKQL